MAIGKQLFRDVAEQVWHRGDLEFIRQAYRPTFVGNTPRRKLQDLGAYRAHVTSARAAFPDIRIDVLSQLAEADLTATRFRIRGTHLGEFIDIAPTGRSISVEGMTIQRLAGGRIAESWNNWDITGLLADLDAAGTTRRIAPRNHGRR